MHSTEGAGASGDQWLKATLTALEIGCDQHDMKIFEESPEEAAFRTGPTQEQLTYARSIFKGIAKMHAPPETINQESLVTAQQGDFRLFEKDSTHTAACRHASLCSHSEPCRACKQMDLDQHGEVNAAEFVAFLSKEHSVKRIKKKGSGDKAPIWIFRPH